MASFGADTWNPRDMGSHSTDDKSRDQRVKWKVVYVRVSNKYGYKIKKKVSGEIEGATSETRHTATQIWLKNLLVKKINKKVIGEPSLLPSTLKCYHSCLSLHEGCVFPVLGFLICWLCTLYEFYTRFLIFIC